MLFRSGIAVGKPHLGVAVRWRARSAETLRGAADCRPKREKANAVSNGRRTRYISAEPSIAPSPRARVVLADLGFACGALGDHAKKKELLERALAINEAAYGPEHTSVATTLTNLGNAYGDLGDPAKQKELQERQRKERSSRVGGLSHKSPSTDPAACPSTHPCYAAAAASKPLYLIIASRTFLFGFSASKMASHSCSALGG